MSNNSRNWLLLGICTILTLVTSWLASQSGFLGLPSAPEPIPTTSSSGMSQEIPWRYPNSNIMYSIEADDFALALDGSFMIRSDYRPGGLTKGYLEHCLKLTPTISFEVEELGKGNFRIILPNGKNIPRTQIELPGDPNDAYPPEPFSAWIEPHLAARIVTQEGNDGAPIDLPFIIEFSHPMNFTENLNSLITFSPDIACEIKGEGNKITVTPTEMLKYGTTYYVIISGMLNDAEGIAFPSDQQKEFITESRDFSLIITNQSISTVAPESKIDMEYQLDTAGRGTRTGEVILYSINSSSGSAFEEYLKFLESMPLPQVIYAEERDWRNPIYQTAPGAIAPTSMKEIDSWKGDFPEGISSVSFENPGKGFYITSTSIIDTKTKQPLIIYKPIQVTTPSVYMQSAKGENLFWLNDSQTGEALSGYTIRFLRGDFESELGSTITAEDGSALINIPKPRWSENGTAGKVSGEMLYTFTGFPNESASLTPEEAERRNQLSTVFVIYDRAGKPVYADTTASLSDEVKRKNHYYSFFYLDRALYRPTDEIHFWGYLKPYAYNTSPMLQTLTVSFDSDGIDTRAEVKVNPDGTYDGIIKLDKVISAEYSVNLEYMENNDSEPQVLDSEWIEVNEFQKPSYVIEATTDKPIYHWGDQITVTLKPTFFDGTPAPNMPLECSVFNPSTGNIDAITTVQTDPSGKAIYTFKAGDCLRFDYNQSWTPKRAYFYIKITSEGENVTYQGHYNYIPGDIAIRSTMEIDSKENAKLTILANQITLDKIKTEDDLKDIVDEYYYSENSDSRYDILLGEPANVKLTAMLKTEYCRPYDGSYDEKYYDYNEQQRSLSVDLKNGRAVVENLIEDPRRPKTYLSISANVSYVATGCTVETSSGATNGYARFASTQDANPRGYSFAIYLNDDVKPMQQREEFMLRDTLTADAGDKMRFVLCKDGQELVKSNNGKLLYTLLQDNVVEHAVTGTTFELTENPTNANAVTLVAAYFDGHNVYPVTNCEITMNQESVKLQLETTSDKESYLPGEKVTLHTKVTNMLGKPVSANLCLSVVDEAVFALREQNIDIISTLYSQMGFYNYFVSKYTSLTGDIDPYNAGGDGGKGDGESLLAYDVFRKNFKDTALFYPTKSDANGEAIVSFILPDNLTSWRVTTLAVDNFTGGQNRSNVITSMPFFVKPVLSSKYIAGDEISMLVQGYGTALDASSLISYSVTIKGNGTENTQTFQQRASEPLTVTFGKLSEGEYIVTSTAAFGEQRDTVELPLSIIHSNLELNVHQAFDPKQPVKFPASRYPVTITFYDAKAQPYYDCLNQLLLQCSQSMTDRMSLYIAKTALLRTSDENSLPANLRAVDNLAVYQRDNGGISDYMTDIGETNNDADPILTTYALLVAPEQFSVPRIKTYLLNVTGDSTYEPEAQAAAWAGLATIDNTYGAKLQELLQSNPEPTLTEKLWYGIGLSYADPEIANVFYDETAVPKLDLRGEIVRMDVPENPDERDHDSALAWIIASNLKLVEADGYAKYFANGSLYGGYFEAMFYLKNYPIVPSPIKFSYTGGGKTGEVDLSIIGNRTITFSSDMLEGLKFNNVPEDVMAVAYYVGEPEEANMVTSDKFSIAKTVKPLENGKYENTITVKLSDEASYGYYSISDWIPSNSRLHSITQKTSDIIFNNTQEGQKLYFGFYHSQNDSGILMITYYTQRAYNTEAVQDRTYLICADSGETAQTERGIFS